MDKQEVKTSLKNVKHKIKPFVKTYWREMLVLAMFLFLNAKLNAVIEKTEYAGANAARAANYSGDAMYYASDASDYSRDARDYSEEIVDILWRYR